MAVYLSGRAPGQMGRIRGASSLTPPLDLAGVSAYAAYSFSRKLRAGYAGNAFKVRRSSDNATQNIGFVGSAVDTASLLSFVGANSGYIDTVYDQSGNANDLAQATTANQPRIVNAGVLDTVNGQAAPYFNGSSQYLKKAITAQAATGWSFQAAVKRNGSIANQDGASNFNGIDGIWKAGDTDGVTGGAGFAIMPLGVNSSKPGRPNLFSTGWYYNDGAPHAPYAKNGTGKGTPLVDPAAAIWDGTISGSTTAVRRNGVAYSLDNVQTGSPPSVTGELQMGTASIAHTGYWPGNIGELIIFNSDQDAALATMRPNMLSWWAYADYSSLSRGVKTTYNTNNIQVGNVLQYEYTQPWTATFEICQTDDVATSVIFTNVINNAPYTGWEVWMNGGFPGVRIMNTVGTKNVDVTSTFSVSDGSRHVVVITYDGSGLASGVNIYVDGVATGKTVNGDNLLGNTIVAAGQSFYIASQQYSGAANGSFQYASPLYRLQIDNVARSSGWANAVTSDATFPAVDGNTQLRYDFADSVSGTTAADSSGNGRNATLSSTGIWLAR